MVAYLCTKKKEDTLHSVHQHNKDSCVVKASVLPQHYAGTNATATFHQMADGTLQKRSEVINPDGSKTVTIERFN